MTNAVQATLREAAPLLVIDLHGEVTAMADATITGAYRTASERGAKAILLNLSGVQYLNSAGISVIIGILTEAIEAGQRLLVTGLTRHYSKIFEMMGLSEYAPIFETEDDARRFVRADDALA